MATLDRIDSTHANAIEIWIQAGSPEFPTSDEIAAEMAASKLIPESIPLNIGSDSTSATVTVTMEPYSVARVRFSFLTK
jgi:beta-xylosidase